MRTWYLATGTALVAIGVIGFVQNAVYGVYFAHALHHGAHLGSGILTLAAAARGIGPMRLAGKTLGFFYLAFALAGTVAPDGNVLGLIQLNRVVNILHGGLAIVYLYVGLLAPPRL